MQNQALIEKIDQTLHSLDEVKRAEANPYLFTRIMEGMKQPVKKILKPVLIWQVAASLVLILGLNIAIGIGSTRKNAGKSQPSESTYFTNTIYSY
jgi:hypothetical protein